MKNNATKKMVFIGMFGAVSAILMLLEFPLPFLAPSFIKLEFSDLPIILGGYMMGPVSGLIIAVLKIALNLLITGAEGLGVGELANFLGSVSYLLPAVFIYHRNKTKKGAKISLVVGTITASTVIVLADIFILIPAYAAVMDIADIVAMTDNALVGGLPTLALCSLLPFNLLKYGITSVITILVYKRMKKILQL